VYKDNEKVYVEFEGDKGQIMSYLYVGAFAYHIKRIRVATDELEKIESELTTEVIEWGRRNSQREETRNAMAAEVQVPQVEKEWDEEEWDGEEEDEE
jgi:phosphatidylserine decarboxylase